VILDGEIVLDGDLVPIVLSHGLAASRTFFSVLCRDLASMGFVVFAIDHQDGSCVYTQKENGEEIVFDTLAPFICPNDMFGK